jgi:DNA-binding NarL/FixJ family response regulator
MPTSFLIVDDHPLFVEALRLVVQGAFPGAIVHEATSIESAQAAIEREDRLDLVLLDLSGPAIRSCRSSSFRPSKIRASSTR